MCFHAQAIMQCAVIYGYELMPTIHVANNNRLPSHFFNLEIGVVTSNMMSLLAQNPNVNGKHHYLHFTLHHDHLCLTLLKRTSLEQTCTIYYPKNPQ